MRIRKDVSLIDQHTFHADVTAAWFAEAHHLTDLVALLRSGVRPALILGEGSNVLFAADFPGLVIKNCLLGKSFRQADQVPGKGLVEVAAGENWADFVAWTLEQGLGGLENLSLIPGTAGAAPIQNIGAYGVELSDLLLSLEAYDIEQEKLVTLDKEVCRFGYRSSRFKEDWKGRFVITRLFLLLSAASHSLKTAYGDLESRLQHIPAEKRKPSDVARAVIDIRKSKLPDPALLGNAGSFFKNPVVEGAQFETLLNLYPDLVFFPQGEGQYKIPAAWLLDKGGWKGKQIGRVACHDRQPLVIVNVGGAGGEEILEFAKMVATDISARFGIVLEPEVNMYPPGKWLEDTY